MITVAPAADGFDVTAPAEIDVAVGKQTQKLAWKSGESLSTTSLPVGASAHVRLVGPYVADDIDVAVGPGEATKVKGACCRSRHPPAPSRYLPQDKVLHVFTGGPRFELRWSQGGDIVGMNGVAKRSKQQAFLELAAEVALEWKTWGDHKDAADRVRDHAWIHVPPHTSMTEALGALRALVSVERMIGTKSQPAFEITFDAESIPDHSDRSAEARAKDPLEQDRAKALANVSVARTSMSDALRICGVRDPDMSGPEAYRAVQSDVELRCDDATFGRLWEHVGELDAAAGNADAAERSFFLSAAYDP